MLHHPSDNFEIQKNEPRFNDIFLKNNLPKTNDRTYLINLDDYKLIGTQWIALHVNRIYFDSVEFEHTPKINMQQKYHNKYF